MAVKQNASTIRTRQRLHDACLRLAELQDISSLNVNQIADEAGLNRTTFYLHYPDVDSLIESVIDELLDRLNEGGVRLINWDPGSADEWEETFFRTIAERPELFRRLLSGSREHPLVRRFLSSSESAAVNLWAHYGYISALDDAYVSMKAKFTAAGVLGMTVGWLEAGMPVDADRICRWIWQFVMTIGASLEPSERKMNPSVAANERAPRPGVPASQGGC